MHFVHGDKGIVFLYCSANVNYTPDIQINFDYCNSSCPHCLQLFCCLAVFRILNERIITEFFFKSVHFFIHSVHSYWHINVAIRQTCDPFLFWFVFNNYSKLIINKMILGGFSNIFWPFFENNYWITRDILINNSY